MTAPEPEDRAACRYCLEPVLQNAKRCPHCTQWLTRWRSPLIQSLFLYVLSVAIFGPLYFQTFQSPADFADHKNDLKVVESTFSYSPGSSTGFIACIGTLRNDGSITWEDPQIEVQYFNSAGDRIDAFTNSAYALRIRPQQQVAFRVSGHAARSRDQYVTHRVTIRNADEDRDLW